MTISQTIIHYSKQLKSSSPILDVELLLAITLNKSKEYLYTYPEKKLTTKQLNNFTTLFKRRTKGEPIAYILGHKEFYGLDFKVNKNVLIPRPETEQLVEDVIKFYISAIRNPQSAISIIEIGVGSGALIISLAKSICHPELSPSWSRPGRRMNKCLVPQFIGTDISPKALTIAKQNAKAHNVFCHGELVSARLGRSQAEAGLSRTIDKKPCIKFLHGNLLKPLTKLHQPEADRPLADTSNFGLRTSDFILVANLPYLETKEMNKQLSYEPKLALTGGPDGLKYFREFFHQLQQYKFQPQAIFLEIGHNQGAKITKLAKQALPGYKAKVEKDMCGFDRILIIAK
jgi:release factor glutamine methyltransferase